MRKIVYIAGIGRNGGTLFDRTLGQINNFFSLGELRFIWQKGVRNNELCNCRQAFGQCEFWKEVMSDEFLASLDSQDVIDLYMKLDRTRYLPFLAFPFFQSKTFKINRHNYQDIVNRLYCNIFSVSGANVLVDSSKFVGHGMFLADIPGVEFHVVHLVRDSRATAYSWKKKRVKEEVVGKEVYMRQYGCGSSSFQWLYRNILSEVMRKKSKSYTIIKYEDFCKDPKGTIKHVLREVGEEEDVGFVTNDTIVIGQTHTQSGNPSRFIEGGIEVKADNEWENEMKVWDKIISTIVSLPGLVRYKYRIMK